MLSQELDGVTQIGGGLNFGPQRQNSHHSEGSAYEECSLHEGLNRSMPQPANAIYAAMIGCQKVQPKAEPHLLPDFAS
jgi:hypothetical protein